MRPETTKRHRKAQHIARTALTLLSQKGYRATRMEQIAEAADIGKSTLYEYYRTKEELFIAAIHEAGEDWISELAAIGRQTADPVERLHRIAEYYLECLKPENRGDLRLFFEVLRQAFMEDGVFYHRRHLIRQLHQRIVKIVVDYLLAGVSSGRFVPAIARDAETIAINFLAYLDGIQLHAMIDDNYIDARQQVAFFMTHLVPLLLQPVDEKTPHREHDPDARSWHAAGGRG